MQVLITGGAGFIGSHLADALVARGDQVRVFDNLEPQVHGPERRWPVYTDARVERTRGDVRDRSAVAGALRGVEIVFHLAAATGVGQSMYQIAKYFEVNVQGTANLLDALANENHGVRKLILASSRAVYGEGAYNCTVCGMVHPPVRSPSQLDRAAWEAACPHCGGSLLPELTPETLTPDPGSMYAITKWSQEQMCARFGEAYGMPIVILRLFNVCGPRQSLSNPYTGIITSFANRILGGRAPEVYEDGLMTRDFVHVSDVVRALVQAGEVGGPESGVYNIGSGCAITILELAERMCALMAPSVSPQVSGRARVGDIRHCVALTTRAATELGFRAATPLDEGLTDAGCWSEGGRGDASVTARDELVRRRLLR